MAMESVKAPAARQSPLVTMAQAYNLEPAKLLEVLKATVIKSTDKHVATNEEIAAFVIVANQYQLNPFTREIHAFCSSKAGVVPIVGIDGWSAIVNRRADFDGCTFRELVSEEGQLLGMECSIYVRGRSRSTTVPEYLAECKRPTIFWQTMPRRMMRHKAFIQAARLAFSLSGIYDPDEGMEIIKNAAAGAQQRPSAFQAPAALAQPGAITGDDESYRKVISEALDIAKSAVAPGPERQPGDDANEDVVISDAKTHSDIQA